MRIVTGLWTISAALCLIMGPTVGRAEGAGHALPKGRWVVIDKAMVGCGAMADFPAVRAAALKAVRAWKRGQDLPTFCGMLEPGEIYLLEADQRNTAGGRIVRLLHIQCKQGCSPYIRAVYVPPERQVGRFMKPTTKPDTFPGD